LNPNAQVFWMIRRPIPGWTHLAWTCSLRNY
jgi:hypothetical protein